MELELLDFGKQFPSNAQHSNLCHTFELQLLWGVINVDETNIGLLMFFIYVCFHLISLQLPPHLLHA
jgi:hypothetical protein